MNRFTSFSVFVLSAALIICTVLFGFASDRQETTDVSEVAVSISSEYSTAPFEVSLEAESGFSVVAREGTTPMTFTIEAENFSGAVRPVDDATLRVEVKSEGGSPTATRTSPTPTRLVKEGSNFSLTEAKPRE